MQSPNSDDLLQFRDYSSNSPSSNSPPAQINVNSPTHSSSSGGGGGGGGNGTGRQRGDPLSDLIYDMSHSGDAGLGRNGGGGGAFDTNAAAGADGGAGNNKVSFLTLEYYQRFFNVDTYMVLERIANSMIPKRAASNYLRLNIGVNPDLYGPLWIAVTLIFSIAISGNIASYLQLASDTYHWHYNFHLVSYAATCIFLYANILPVILWALFKYSIKPTADGIESDSADYTPSLLSLMCIYGYSLAIYVPVSILWVIQISILQWLLVITAALLSGTVLISVLTPALRNSKFSLFIIIGIIGAHFLLAAGFMLSFFHTPSNPYAVTPTPAPAPAAAAVDALKAVIQAATAAPPVSGDIVNSSQVQSG